MGQFRQRKVRELASLAAATLQIAAAEYRDLERSLESVARDGTAGSIADLDSVVGELGAIFQVVAGHIDQIRIMRTGVARICRRD